MNQDESCGDGVEEGKGQREGIIRDEKSSGRDAKIEEN